MTNSKIDFKAWQAEGGTTLRQRAQDKVLGILESHQPEPLSSEILREMDIMLAAAVKDCRS